jgi:ABC-type glycerol-3-phosphate transport system substrate-binding protein
MLRKQFICLFRIFAFFGICFILNISCKSRKTDENFSNLNQVKTKCTINFEGHWLGEGDREKLLLETLKDYEFVNQEVKVNLTFPEQILSPLNDDTEIKFIIDQIQKPVADYDIIRIKEHYSPIASKLSDPQWGEKYLVDFSKIPAFMNSHNSFINSTTLKSRAGGIIFGPYNEGQLWSLYVNTEVAKLMGIEVKQYGMTFDDFAGYIKAAYEYNKSHDYIAPIFEDAVWISTEALFKQLFYSCNNYDDNMLTDMTPAKFKSVEKCYRAFGELVKYEPIIKTRSSINWTNDNDFPLKNKCLFFVNGTWMYNIWKQKGKDRMNIILPCELPVFNTPTSYIGGYASNWCVPKNAPNRDEAIKLMMYWCKPEIAEKWVTYTKCPSGTKGNLSNTTFGVDPYESFMYTINQKYGQKMFAQQENKYIFGSKNYKVQIRLMELLEGKMTSDQIISDLKRSLVY